MLFSSIFRILDNGQSPETQQFIFKMAPLDEVLQICSGYMDENHRVNKVNKCSNCAKMRNYLKVVTTELKSEQSIIKILTEELKVNEHNIFATFRGSFKHTSAPSYK
jgi:hypothetical protein